MKEVCMIIAFENFRDEEYFEPKEILENAGINVITVSWQKGIARGKLGGSTRVDLTLSEVDVSRFDCIIFVGGPGCKRYWDDKTAHKICEEAVKSGRLLTAICSAPVTLARSGVLKGKKATCYPADKEELEKQGVNYTGKDVEEDGLIITADGPASAGKFAQKIASKLQ